MPSARYDGRPGHSCLKRFDAGTTTLLKFRHLLERHELPRAMLGEINAVFAQKGLLLHQGMIVDATITARVRGAPFHIIKSLFGHRKVRYRGLTKNTAQLHTLFALANLVIGKRAPTCPSVNKSQRAKSARTPFEKLRAIKAGLIESHSQTSTNSLLGEFT